MNYINPANDVQSCYTKIPNFILINQLKLTDIQRSFYFYIWGKVYAKNGYAEFSLNEIARELGYSKQKTIRIRTELINLGLIDVVSTKNRYGGNGKTRYLLKDVTTLVENSELEDSKEFHTSLQEVNKQNEIPKSKQQEQKTKSKKFNKPKNIIKKTAAVFPSSDNGNVLNELLKRNVNPTTAKSIVDKHEKSKIFEYINYVDYLISKKEIKNLGAFLTSAIKQNYDTSELQKHLQNKEIEYKQQEIQSKKQKEEKEEENKIISEKNEMEKAFQWYNQKDEKSKSLIDNEVNRLITEKYGKPQCGLEAFRRIVLCEIYKRDSLQNVEIA